MHHFLTDLIQVYRSSMVAAATIENRTSTFEPQKCDHDRLESVKPTACFLGYSQECRIPAEIPGLRAVR